MVKDIEAIVSPKSIAVVGATNRPGSVGLAIFSNILNADYQGILHPVNPRARSVHGVKAYPRLLDIPEDIYDASVYIDGDYMGERLSLISDVARGKHVLEIKSDLFIDKVSKLIELTNPDQLMMLRIVKKDIRYDIIEINPEKYWQNK